MADNHGIEAAQSWLSEIVAMVAALEAARGAGIDAECAAQDAIMEAPYAIRVRSGWYNPADAEPEPSEYEILLSGGGPAVRVTGDLDAFSQPDTARLEWQDWGTPWTAFPLSNEEREAVLTFAQQFHFGG